MDPRPLLLDQTPATYPLAGYRRRQLLEWIFEHGATHFETMSSLPGSMRQELAAEFRLTSWHQLEAFRSSDGSTKFLFTLNDGMQTEAVYMPYLDRQTICVSTMVGCPAGCSFCATGKLGFGRNLSSGEIIGQVLAVAKHEGISPRSIRNLVFMGMGEPLLNYEQTLQAAQVLLDEEAFGMSKRRITLSTVGLPEKIVRLAHEEINLKLAISLHAPDEETRQRIVPTAHAHTISAILEAAQAYQRISKRRITFEYAMLRDVNDSTWQATLLAERLQGLIAHVNLIPMNPWPGAGFSSSSEARIQLFLEILETQGIPTSVRRSRGRDAGAACGQLALQRP